MESSFHNDVEHQNSNPHFEALLEPLLQTRPWAMLCAVLGLFVSGLMVIFALVLILGMSGALLAGSMFQEPFSGGIAVVMGIVYLIFGVVFALPPYWLYRFAKSIRMADKTRETSDIIDALKYQKSFWKFIGICVLIYLGFVIISLVFVAIAAFISA
ncbi:hypothetical protein [Glaciecola sp. SC05]|uniref:hypothetical protein n=1 Tax=Glaciecola sp. SC05 TaxID=1987355 RepID=UPI003526D6DF